MLYSRGNLCFNIFDNSNTLFKKEASRTKYFDIFDGLDTFFKENTETERNKRKEIRTKALIILTLCLSIYTLSCGCFYAYKLHNPTIVYQDCYYLRTYSWRKGRLRNENDYTFSDDENGKNVTFRMPNKEEIYPDKFSKDTLYRVYYEKSTSYIVKIEEIDE